MEILWSFSRFVQIFAEVPQLMMVHNISRMDSCLKAYYLCVTGHVVSYCGNWVYRYADQFGFKYLHLLICSCSYYTEGMYDPIAIMCGVAELVVVTGYFVAVSLRSSSEDLSQYSVDLKK